MRLTVACLMLSALLVAPRASAQCESMKFNGSGGGANPQLGNAVGISGDAAIIGAHFYDGAGADSGAVWVLQRQPDGSWAAGQQLLASDEAEQDRFGFAVDVTGGNTAIVGARYNDDSGYGSGSAYIFEFDGTDWNETAYLTASDEAQADLFSTSVSISGTTAIAGASGDSDFGANTGQVYVFDNIAGVWTETAMLSASVPTVDDRVGGSVALDSEGGNDVIVAGALGADDFGSQSGAAYVFERSGSTWTETGRLVASDGAAADLFGEKVAVDGDVIVVGALLADAPLQDSGAAYVFEKQPDDTWLETKKLTANDAEAGDFFGASVAVSGNRILVGAWSNDNNRGSAYVFEDLGAGWELTDKLQASDIANGDNFGHAVDLDGARAVIGARLSKDVSSNPTGAAYVYTNLDAFRTLGNGCPGSGGFVPTLSFSGCPAPGGSTDLELVDGLGGAFTGLFIGLTEDAVPLPTGCSVNISPFLMIAAFNLTAGGPGDGGFLIPLAIPVGSPEGTLTFQTFSQDPGALGLTASNGVEIKIAAP